jgi:hypothetical protein
MLCQSLNPPQRPLPEPGPESSAVPHGQRGAPIARSFTGPRCRRFVWFGCPHYRLTGSHGKRERTRCARGNQQAVASQRSCDREIAFGKSKVKSSGRLLPTAGERFVCDWFGAVCERGRVDNAASRAPESASAYGVAGHLTGDLCNRSAQRRQYGIQAQFLGFPLRPALALQSQARAMLSQRRLTVSRKPCHPVRQLPRGGQAGCMRRERNRTKYV